MFSHSLGPRRVTCGLIAAMVGGAMPCAAQVAAPPARAAADDTPSIRIGATIFADYTVTQPTITDSDGNDVTLSAFQVQRSYINVTGNISRRIAFRITPDITREVSVASTLNGSMVFRLKYAYAQWNLDDSLGRGTFARFGMQQNPYFDFMENVYRYRFQGTIFTEREGYQSSADVGAAFRYNLPGDYGDIHTGFFNGENYNRAEVNDQKAFMFRGTLRPLPGSPVLSGLRLTGFINKDAYVKNADRTRALFAATFEHRYVNAAFEYMATKDQPSTTVPAEDGRGWSVFVTPRSSIGWEGLLRFDHLQPDTAIDGQVRERSIAGIAYWFPVQGSVATALMFDVDNATFEGFSTPRSTLRRYAIHALVSF